MRAKKVFLTMAVVFSMVAIFAVSAHAGVWYTCTVEKAGSGAGNHVCIWLSDTNDPPAFTNRFFTAPDGRKKEMLAIALTAMTTGKQVEVGLVNLGSCVIMNMWLLP